VVEVFDTGTEHTLDSGHTLHHRAVGGQVLLTVDGHQPPIRLNQDEAFHLALGLLRDLSLARYGYG
jgi:hypothetical protein